MPKNIYELLWIFIIYAFIGWCVEVSYAAVDRGIFVNRGFLNGPYCPIYGCGVVIVVAVLTPLKENLIILFLGSFLLTSVLEYITGYLLEKVFHNKWWDYSNLPFNIKGYVCLKFSIYWGLACMFIMEIIHPIIYRFITIIPHIIGIMLITILITLFFVDVCITVSTILKLNKKIKMLDEIGIKIHKLSDEIGEHVYENTAIAMEKTEEFQKYHEDIREKIEETKTNISEKKTEFNMKQRDAYKEKRQELETLKLKYRDIASSKTFGFKRLIKAFPNMKSIDHKEALEKYKILLKNMKRK